jgi:hypothetical protein
MSRKENALDLAKFVDKSVKVKLSGGREGGLLRKSYKFCTVTEYDVSCDTFVFRSTRGFEGV